MGAKLQLKPGQTVAVLARPVEVEVELPEGVTSVPSPGSADAVVVFVRNERELAKRAGPVLGAARADRLAWIAYPKAGQLGTDLNRERLAALMSEQGVQPVRQVAIDETWSALRFRPA